MPSQQFESFVTQLGMRKDVASALWEADIHSPQELAAMHPDELQNITNTPLLINSIHPILQKYVFNISMAKDPYKKALAVVKKHAAMEDDSDEDAMETGTSISADSTSSDAAPYVDRPGGANPTPARREVPQTTSSSSVYNNNAARMNTNGGRMTQSHIGFTAGQGKRPLGSGNSINISGGNFVQASILGTGPVTYNNTNTVINTNLTAGPDLKKRRAQILNETMLLNGTRVRVADFGWMDNSNFWVNDIKFPSTNFETYENHMDAKDIYGVRNHGSSRALILNNITFTARGMSTRTGADMDCVHMEQMLEKLGFVVRRENNKTAAEMKSLLHDFASDRANMKADMVAVYIGSHGERDQSGCDTFVGTDGNRVNFNDVKEMFSPQNSKLLRNKPKMFFLQFCRQDNARDPPAAPLRQTARYVGSDALPDTEPKAQATEDPATEAETRPMDMLCVYATMAGNKAYRDTKDGSWFVTAMIRTFTNHADKDDLLSMLTKVNNSVAINEGMENNTKALQISEVVHNLRKKIFFYPGLM